MYRFFSGKNCHLIHLFICIYLLSSIVLSPVCMFTSRILSMINKDSQKFTLENGLILCFLVIIINQKQEIQQHEIYYYRKQSYRMRILAQLPEYFKPYHFSPHRKNLTQPSLIYGCSS